MGGGEEAIVHHGYRWRRRGDHEGIVMVTAMCHATWWCVGWCRLWFGVSRSRRLAIDKWRQVANDKQTAVVFKTHIEIVEKIYTKVLVGTVYLEWLQVSRVERI